MKTQHTQGEWMAKEGQIYPQETGVTLALIPYFDDGNNEQQANAKLIAAAPELLKALQDILGHVPIGKDYFTHGEELSIHKAEQAIIKATE